MKKNRQQKNNRLIIYSLLISCLFTGNQYVMSQSTQSIETWFVNMPDVLNPTLTRQNRLELLEYHKAGRGDSITNRFGNQAYLQTLDTLHQQIMVKNTPSSTFEMKILYLEDNTEVLGIIRTVCAPVCLSNVEFYDTAWNVIPLRFEMPKAIEWVNSKSIPTDIVDVKWIQSLMDVSFISLRFTAKDQFIKAKNNTLDFLSEDDRKALAPYVSDKPILFELKQRTWRRKP
jgi:hypothetical protein